MNGSNADLIIRHASRSNFAPFKRTRSLENTHRTMKKTLIPDLLAGLTVSFAALSLGAAFGVMSGRGAFAGMISAAVIPIITSLFGGTRLQASGPTAPMTAVSSLVIAFAYEHFHGKGYSRSSS
jgi:MFS superfamily sulfate permease-like transporter